MTDKREQIYDGDMVLDENQIKAISASPNFVQSAAKEKEEYRWPKGEVAYVISESSANDRGSILEAMQLWEEISCIRFMEIEEDERIPHLIFVKKNGCWSSVGKKYYKDGQDVSIGRGCANKFIVAHEIAHALGFYHEQNRPDRDKYIAVLMENVKDERKKNFALALTDITTFGLPYDFGSVMHYGRRFFSMNGRNTIVPKDALMNFVIGQRERLSFLDVKLMNMMYKCDATCESKPECKNEGFVNQNCICHCTGGFEGTTCEKPVTIQDPPCGGKYEVETTIDTGTTFDSQCAWVLKAPENKRVKIEFTKFKFTKRDPFAKLCRLANFVEVRDSGEFEGKVYCGNELEGKTLTLSNEVAVLCEINSDYDRRLTAKITFV